MLFLVLFLNARPKFGFKHFSILSFIAFAQGVLSALTDNIHFSSIASFLPGLNDAIKAYGDAIEEARNRDKLKIEDRNSKRVALSAVLKAIAGVVMSITSDRSILVTSGFEISDGRGPVHPVGQPAGLKTAYIPGVSGSMKL